jgi:hypothetical protein
MSAERDSVSLVAEPPFERLTLTGRVFHSLRRSLHRHQLLSLFDFADGLFADRE